MWLTRLSITRPVTILMLVLTLVILGLMSRSRLPVDLNPDVDIPYLIISTVYAGTGPEEMETLVTKPIEDQLSTISGLKRISSTSSEGVSQISLEFELGTDINDVAADVRSKLDALRNMLPQDAKAPVVQKIDIGAMPVIELNLSSSRLSSMEVRRLADDVIKDRLSQLPGVAAVNISGGDTREIRVEVDKSRLEAYNLSINQVVTALKGENLNLPSGTVEEPTRNYAVRVMGEFASTEQILDVRIASASGNSNLRVGDVAKVIDTIAQPSMYTRQDGGSSVKITIQKQSDANTVKVVDVVKDELERLTGQPYTDAGLAAAKKGSFVPKVEPVIPNYVEIGTSQDQSTFIKDSLADVYTSLIEGALLAVLIVFLFLHSVRGTLIVALAIPTSIISTFLIMDLLGFTINTMSMLGLSLAVGILVDDSIVVLENIHRHLKMGATPKEAAIRGRTEIGLAAMTITLVDVVVFVPIAFTGGLIGQFFRQFGIVIASATLFSLFFSFTLTPMLASRWLKPHEREEEEEMREEVHPGLFRRFTNAWERGYGRVESLYRGILAWSLDHHAAVLTIGVMVLVGSIGTAFDRPLSGDPKAIGGMFVLLIVIGIIALIGIGVSALTRKKSAVKSVPASRPILATYAVIAVICIFAPTKFGYTFFPQTDQRQFSISVEQSVGTPLDVTDKTARMLEADLRNPALFSEVKHVSTTVGAGGGSHMSSGTSAADSASIGVELIDKPTLFERARALISGKRLPRVRSTDEVVAAINARYTQQPGVKISASLPANGPGGAPINIEVSAPDTTRMLEAAYQIEAIVKKHEPATYGTELSWREGRPELQALIDRDRAAQYGLSVAQVAAALRTSMEGDISSKYRENGKEYDIRVSLPEDQRDFITQVPSMVVGNTSNGRPVHLYEVVKIVQAGGPTKIERKNRQRAVTITAQIATNANLGNVQPLIMADMKALNLSGVTVNWGGQTREMEETSKNMLSALLLSVVLVFILMAALFESIVAPFIIWLSVPQAMAGALVALTLTHKPLSIISAIGFIMLVGLVTKNAILLVDYTNTLRSQEGLDRRSALLMAGPTRLRPILMTTMAMIFGMMPTAIALSKGSEMRQPMAIAVIGGLLLAMFLSLLMVPTFYEIVDGFGEWFARMKTRIIERSHI